MLSPWQGKAGRITVFITGRIGEKGVPVKPVAEVSVRVLPLQPGTGWFGLSLATREPDRSPVLAGGILVL